MSLALSAKAFSVSAPSVWNSLSHSCTSAQLLSTVKRGLKTEQYCLILPAIVNVNTQPSLCHYVPLRHMALYKCVLFDDQHFFDGALVCERWDGRAKQTLSVTNIPTTSALLVALWSELFHTLARTTINIVDNNALS